MNNTEKTYTYRGGQKIELDKSLDQMVVRTLPGQFDDTDVIDTEQVSSASTRATTRGGNLEDAMTRNRDIAPTHHAYYESESGEEFLITDRIFVIFKEPPTDTQLDEFAAKYALIKKEAYSDKDFLFQLTAHTGINPVKLVVALTEDDPDVEVAEHDLNQRMTTYQPLSLPDDPEYINQWHLHTQLNDPDFDVRSSSLCEEAWELLDGFGDPNIVVCVSDDGCKIDHQDFDSGNKFSSWGYFKGQQLITRGDIGAIQDDMYKQGANHGTSCAGVIAGETDSVLTVGAAPGCKLLPIKWQSQGPSLLIGDSKFMTVLNRIEDKIDVMSNSWGKTPSNLRNLTVVNKIKSLAESGGRRGKGIVFLWAAGNENCPINHTASVDVPYTNGIKIINDTPFWEGVKKQKVFRNNLVGVSNVMHIAALASTAQRSHYSNYGSGITLCAPSSNSHEYWRLTVRGLGITTATGNSGGVRDDFGGTSSSTPLVAGIVGLVISANPDLNALDVISILNSTADKDLSFQSYPRTPPATFDNDTSWDVSPVAPFDTGDFVDNGDEEGSWSPWFGHGCVNAKAAVAEALKRKQSTGDLSFKGDASPDITIPDNDSTGIEETITCDKDFSIASVSVEVDISHTYIGDLQITLISPSGTEVVLHARNTGGRADDLNFLYDINNTSGLHHLSSELSQGDWVLRVQDLARKDEGTLNQWGIKLTGETDPSIRVQESPGIIIPDNDQVGIERTLSVSDSGEISEIEIDVDITHSFIRDLQVTLTSPGDITVPLHSRSGDNSDNIVTHYKVSNTPLLAGFQGDGMTGDWTLKVSDHERRDTGKLNHWGLRIVPV